MKSKSKIDKGIDLAARKFSEALQTTKPPSPKLIELMAFRAQQAAFAACHDYNLAECDYNYFKNKGWLERNRQYYTDAKINPLKNMIALMVGKMVKRKTLEDLRGVPWNS